MKTLCTNPEIDSALMECDAALGGLIHRLGPIRIQLSGDAFTALASSIVAQQLSARVADVIWARIVALTGGAVTPEGLLALEEDALRGAGLSGAKARYARALAEAVRSGTLPLDELSFMDDEEIIRSLTAVKGIGRWTAEMFLIFSLGRPDIFSCGDGGLQRAFRWLYGHEPEKDALLRVSSAWAPYRTYASLYLWEALNQKLV